MPGKAAVALTALRALLVLGLALPLLAACGRPLRWPTRGGAGVRWAGAET